MVNMCKEQKYIIQICTGTLCHVMGGAELPALVDYLPDNLKLKVKMKGMVCANYCKDQTKKPPFVLINNELMHEADIEKIINYLQKCESNDTYK